MRETKVKSGKHTTEFWLIALANVISALVSTGAFPQSGPWDKVVALLVMAVTAAPYLWSRHSLKQQELKSLVKGTEVLMEETYRPPTLKEVFSTSIEKKSEDDDRSDPS